MWLREKMNHVAVRLAPHLPDAVAPSVAAPDIAGDAASDAMKVCHGFAARGARLAVNFLGEAVHAKEFGFYVHPHKELSSLSPRRLPRGATRVTWLTEVVPRDAILT